jgi:hypothetical protein
LFDEYAVALVLNDYYISTVATGMDGEIYFLSQPSGTLWYYQPSTNTTVKVSTGDYTALTVDLHGNVWLGDHLSHLWEYAPATATLTLVGYIVTPYTPALTTYGMAAGMHGIIYMAACDSTNGKGYVVWYDPRKAWSPGARGTNNGTMNPASTNFPAGTAPYSLVECNEHGTIFGGTGGWIYSAHLFYYYEAGNADVNNDGKVDGRDITLVAKEFGMDPSGTVLPLSVVAAVMTSMAVVAVASVYKLGSRAKRKKR